jgi:hypothetical protein
VGCVVSFGQTKRKAAIKKQIMQFLKEQIAEYGTTPEILFGESYPEGGDTLKRAEMFVAKAYPNTI